jgi:hypothetical protein
MARSAFVALTCITAPFIFFAQSVSAQDSVPDWPDHYDPFALLTYNLVMSEQDWNAIRHDLSFDIEVPSLFSANSEAPVLVSVRRKSATAFPDADR